MIIIKNSKIITPTRFLPQRKGTLFYPFFIKLIINITLSLNVKMIPDRKILLKNMIVYIFNVLFNLLSLFNLLLKKKLLLLGLGSF